MYPETFELRDVTNNQIHDLKDNHFWNLYKLEIEYLAHKDQNDDRIWLLSRCMSIVNNMIIIASDLENSGINGLPKVEVHKELRRLWELESENIQNNLRNRRNPVPTSTNV